jgi:molybdopterin synthase sulfur carrier subunit
MKLRVLYFASLRERLGLAQEEIELPDERASIAAAQVWLQARGGIWAEALAEGRPIRVALNQSLIQVDRYDATLLHEGAELAFFPPVTGG